MKPILSLYWRLCRLAAGPEDVPFSRELLALTLALWLGLQILAGPFQPQLSWAAGVAAGLAGLGIMAAVTLTLLAFKGLLNRWLQALAALIGIDLVLGFLWLPLLILYDRVPAVREKPLLSVPVLLLLCWQLLAQGFVFHRALNVGPVLGGMIAIFVLYLTHAALNLLFPEMAGTAS